MDGQQSLWYPTNIAPKTWLSTQTRMVFGLIPWKVVRKQQRKLLGVDCISTIQKEVDSASVPQMVAEQEVILFITLFIWPNDGLARVHGTER